MCNQNPCNLNCSNRCIIRKLETVFQNICVSLSLTLDPAVPLGFWGGQKGKVGAASFSHFLSDSHYFQSPKWLRAKLLEGSLVPTCVCLPGALRSSGLGLLGVFYLQWKRERLRVRGPSQWWWLDSGSPFLRRFTTPISLLVWRHQFKPWLLMFAFNWLEVQLLLIIFCFYTSRMNY